MDRLSITARAQNLKPVFIGIRGLHIPPWPPVTRAYARTSHFGAPTPLEGVDMTIEKEESDSSSKPPPMASNSSSNGGAKMVTTAIPPAISLPRKYAR